MLGEVSREEVEGASVVFSNFLGSDEREVSGGDKVGPCGHDHVMV